jgi:activator of 2-hydroxyglutaryl-CoA dehydratase/predicted nucleotide-binding protein (sugar kinase/HSP70/actin superfamily)
MTTRYAGCDLGQSSLKLAILRLDAGRLSLEAEPRTLVHEGRSLERLLEVYRAHDLAGCAALGVTGLHAGELAAPARSFPEDACQEAALSLQPDLPATLTLLRVGARTTSVLCREPGAPARYLENEKCASGTGENLAKIAARFGLGLDEVDALALGAAESIPITARCSVFSKSEMTHYANEGRPRDALFRGYLESIARNAFALHRKARARGPVYLAGGCARLASLRRALEALLGEVRLLPHGLALEAIGAARLAAEAGAARLPADPDALRARGPRTSFQVLAPLASFRDRVTVLDEPATGEPAELPAVLGLDLGSTGAKAALVSLASGALLLDRYDTTRGNPVEAAQRLVRAILESGTPDPRAIGVTGSGRQAVATVLRAVYPELGERIVVLNEIVAHATAAIRCDPDAGADLSVVEIGGQDAKYIRLSGGRIVESDLNKACSAGTGSFLAEQAALYEIHDVSELGRLASAAARPPDLGQMCTVYVAEAATRALEEGFALADVFAGLEYAVIHNYLHRVMGQRRLARSVLLQGKPAQNRSLGWTLAAVSGHRRVLIPANPGAMGAYGIGLCARDLLGRAALDAAPRIALAALGEARVAERAQIVCKDPECRTLCAIDRTVVQIGERRETTFSGGACPKFELATRLQPKLAKDAPDPFAARAELVAGHERGGSGPSLAIPVVGALAGHIPWLATLAAELGFGVTLLRPTRRSLAEGELLTVSFDSCGPAKVSQAVCDGDAPLLLFPRVTAVDALEGAAGDACVTEQAMPEAVARALRARGRRTRVLHPELSFASAASRERGARAIARALDADPRRVEAALAGAERAQAAYRRGLLGLGDEALAYARAHDLPAVVVCGSLHVIHERALNGGIPELLRQNGALAIPQDCVRVRADAPAAAKVLWGDARLAVRVAASARASGELFPLYLSSFGCGPASFVEQIVQSLLEGYPHAVLENDGHGGAAGFVTRIQTFLHGVREHRAQPAVAARPPAAHLEPSPRRGPYLDRGVRYLFLNGIDHLGAVFAATYRAHGYDAVVAPALSPETVACGRPDCSGKECLSYQLLWGSFRRGLEQQRDGKPVRLVQISGRMCRASIFPVKDRLSLERLGRGDSVSVTSLRIAGGAAMSARIWLGLTAMDLLRQLHLYHLAVERDAGEAAALYDQGAREVLAILEEPIGRGVRDAPRLAAQVVRLTGTVERAARAFAALDARAAARERPVVFLSGDAMTKGNDFASGELCPKLAARGVRIVYEPTCDFLEFLAVAHPALIFGQGATPAGRRSYRLGMVALRDELYARVRALHPWLPLPGLRGVLAAADELLARRVNGGSPLMVGSVRHHLASGRYDGAVLAACWGCDNGKIAESLLRHEPDLLALYLYDDGTPLDERRLDAFVFRLERARCARPARPAPAGERLRARVARRLGRLAEVLAPHPGDAPA